MDRIKQEVPNGNFINAILGDDTSTESAGTSNLMSQGILENTLTVDDTVEQVDTTLPEAFKEIDCNLGDQQHGMEEVEKPVPFCVDLVSEDEDKSLEEPKGQQMNNNCIKSKLSGEIIPPMNMEINFEINNEESVNSDNITANNEGAGTEQSTSMIIEPLMCSPDNKRVIKADDTPKSIDTISIELLSPDDVRYIKGDKLQDIAQQGTIIDRVIGQNDIAEIPPQDVCNKKMDTNLAESVPVDSIINEITEVVVAQEDNAAIEMELSDIPDDAVSELRDVEGHINNIRTNIEKFKQKLNLNNLDVNQLIYHLITNMGQQVGGGVKRVGEKENEEIMKKKKM